MNRSFLLLVIAILGLYIPVYSQTTCNTTNASISTSVNGQTVTLVDKSTVPTGSGYRIDYTVNWGDGICSGYSQLTNPVTHTYACSGTYTVKLTVGVFDYSINMYCVITQASSYVYINGPSYLDCSKVKAAMAVSVSGSDVTLVNNSVPTKYCNQITNYNVTWGGLIDFEK